MRLILFCIFACMSFRNNGDSYTRVNFDEFVVLSSVINSEAIHDDFDDGWLIASSVVNRVDHPDFPNSITGVVFQRRQYDGVGTALFKRSSFSDSIAFLCLFGIRHPDVLYFINNKSRNRKFKKQLRKAAKIYESKSHKFYGPIH